MRQAVTGGTGFVGRQLVSRLERPVVLGRDLVRIRRLDGDVIPCRWDSGQVPDPGCFDEVDTVFHLAGEPVFKGRWNTRVKEQILESRVTGTRNLVKCLADLPRPPAHLICASAIGFYGSRGNQVLSETAEPGDDFLARVCRSWEEEAMHAEEFGTRVVTVRIGIVLGKDGGALAKMLTPFRLGLGGRIGSGDQYMSWIHVSDLVDLLLHVAAHIEIRGPVNAVAPSPVTNREFTASLAATLKTPAFLHVPAPILRLTLGEFADVLLGSQRVMPERIRQAGFTFTYPELDAALHDLLH